MMRGILLALFVGLVTAEDGLSAWLRYAPLPEGATGDASLPGNIVVLNATKTSPVYVAGQELQVGFKGILGKEVEISNEAQEGPSVVVGTVDAYSETNALEAENVPELREDGYWLKVAGDSVKIVGQSERAALYGAFKYLSMLAQGNFSDVAFASNPHAPIRWINQWDNLDGTIERGYAGSSIFFKNGAIVSDIARPTQYARILASVGINGIIINNVNADAQILNSRNIDGIGRLADAFRPYGVRIGISVNFASPQSIGGLRTFDPLDQGVINFWSKTADQIYQRTPDFLGFLVKANSEGQPGPLTYQRTLAQGANLFANALKPHGGIVMFRAFVYDHNLNEANWKADRANAAVEFFKELDGKFEDNVVVQIKYGPIDFQVREPVSPLFANLLETNIAIELQVTQEYLGQQCHLVYEPPLWKTITDFDLRVDGEPSLVRDILSGNRFNRPLGGWTAVVNVGMDPTWLGSHLAMSNLYAYGQMAWDPTADVQDLLQDWARLTFGLDEDVLNAVTKMSMESWPAYENYTGNLGIQTLTDILYTHFGPNPASMDDNGWGQWTRADRNGIGMDRTVKNGTGNAGQYPPEIAKIYESVETTPDDLLLWFHHVPYTQRLSTGKTVIQHFYDAHYSGAETAQTFPALWAALEGKVDDERFDHVLYRLTYQAGHAIVWRDAICEFYFNKCGIKDEKDRVRNHPWRVEAEAMQLKGYRATSVTPRETASNLKAVVASGGGEATATATLDFAAGTYDVAVGYYDMQGGRAQWELRINGETVGKWTGDHEDKLGFATSTHVDGHSATRITFRGVAIGKGDTLTVVGKPNGGEAAPLDYVAVLPEGVVD